MMYQQVKAYRQAGKYWLIHTEHVVAHQLLRGEVFPCHGPKDTRIMIPHKPSHLHLTQLCHWSETAFGATLRRSRGRPLGYAVENGIFQEF